MHVHPQQHLGPVVGVGAAVAGVDREDRAGRVVRAVEQGLELELLRRAPSSRVDFGRALRRRTTRPRSAISIIAARSSLRLDRFVERLDDRRRATLRSSTRGLGLLLVVPEAGAGHLGVDRGDARPAWPRSQRESRSWRMPSRIASARSIPFFFHVRYLGRSGFSLTMREVSGRSLTYVSIIRRD